MVYSLRNAAFKNKYKLLKKSYIYLDKITHEKYTKRNLPISRVK